MGEKQRLDLPLGGTVLRITHLEKALWPEGPDHPSLTKGALCRYFVQVAPALVPQLRGRPLTGIRFPKGIAGERIFQKNWRRSIPPFVQRVAAPVEKPGGVLASITVENVATLLWLAQWDFLELHPWLTRLDPVPNNGDPFNHPDILVFDLDPFIPVTDDPLRAKPPLNPAGFAKTVRVAQALREFLHPLGLMPYVKTSGKTGLHVYVPIERRYSFEITRALAEAIGERLARDLPDDVTMAHAIAERRGKVLVDYSQNGKGKIQVAPYSPRATPQATVSMPVTWEELDHIYPTDFTLPTVAARLHEHGNPWHDFFASAGRLERALEALDVAPQ